MPIVGACTGQCNVCAFLAKSRSSRDISRCSANANNLVTGVKIFLHLRPCMARYIRCNVQFYICTPRSTIYLVTSSACNVPNEQRGEFYYAHCVRLITASVKYMTLYFNIQYLPMCGNVLFTHMQASMSSHRLMVPPFWCKFKQARKKELDGITRLLIRSNLTCTYARDN